MSALKVILFLIVACCAPVVAQEARNAATNRSDTAGFSIVVDNSKSIGPYFHQVASLIRLLAEKKGLLDEGQIVRFVDSNRIEAVVDFTADREKLRHAVDLLHTDLGQSAVFDALYVSAQSAAERGPKTAVILVTDGEDRASYYKPEFVYSYLREKRVPVFTVGLVNGLNSKSRKRAVKLLSEIAEQGNGRAFFLESDAEIPGVVNALLSLIREAGKGPQPNVTK